MAVSAIIVNYNGGDDLVRCVESLQSSAEVAEIVVVDNDSTDDSIARAVATFPSIRALHRQNDGFGGGANAGAVIATGDVLLFLNPDVTVAEGTIRALVERLQQEPGVAGPVVRTTAMQGQPEYGSTIDWLCMARGYDSPGVEPLFVQGCALAIDRQTFDLVKGFESRYFLFVEDVEFCWRTLRAGRAVSVVDAVVDHSGGGSIPGGYPGESWFTTETRFVLRERNTLATVFSCAPLLWVGPLVVVNALKVLLIAVVAMATGRRRFGRDLLAGLVWNARQLPSTVRRRMSLTRDPRGSKMAWSRVSKTPFILSLLRHHGRPRLLGHDAVIEAR